MTIPLQIIQRRATACAGQSGENACESWLGPWQCSEIGDVRAAIKSSEKGLCPRGLHPDADAVVTSPARRLRSRFTDRLTAGFKGWLFYLARLCPAHAFVRSFRRSQCRARPHRRRRFWLLNTCQKCGCLIRIKTAIASAECPLSAKRWAAVEVIGGKCRGLDSLPMIGRWFKARGTKGGCCGG